MDHTTDSSTIFKGNAGDAVKFLVLSSDNAGNVEPGPVGVFLPPYNPQINLGSATTTESNAGPDPASDAAGSAGHERALFAGATQSHQRRRWRSARRSEP